MKGGSFYIYHNDTAEFHNLYWDHIKNDGAAHITEKHKHTSPILIDLDFRYANTDAKRVYTADQVKGFTTAYMKVLSECVDLSHDPTIYVLEKPKPKIDKNPAIVKDGIHVIIPGVITTPELQFLVRDRVLESGVISDVFKDCGFTNSAADIFDEQVIQKNNWLMHGSSKPGKPGSSKPNGIPYQVSQTYTYDVSDHTLNVAESKLTGVELIRNSLSGTNLIRHLLNPRRLKRSPLSSQMLWKQNAQKLRLLMIVSKNTMTTTPHNHRHIPRSILWNFWITSTSSIVMHTATGFVLARLLKIRVSLTMCSIHSLNAQTNMISRVL
jgi:hypothetical protein